MAKSLGNAPTHGKAASVPRGDPGGAPPPRREAGGSAHSHLSAFDGMTEGPRVDMRAARRQRRIRAQHEEPGIDPAFERSGATHADFPLFMSRRPGAASAELCAFSENSSRECSPLFDPTRVAGSKVFPFSSHTARVRGATPSRRTRGSKTRSPVRPPVTSQSRGRDRSPVGKPGGSPFNPGYHGRSLESR